MWRQVRTTLAPVRTLHTIARGTERDQRTSSDEVNQASVHSLGTRGSGGAFYGIPLFFAPKKNSITYHRTILDIVTSTSTRCNELHVSSLELSLDTGVGRVGHTYPVGAVVGC